ncbi:MAG: mechanosensitive ion channel family protein [Proteobacteria bacterium]|nr:mechanosensitive ion channel family protein [Pseudomonadota bacterium]
MHFLERWIDGCGVHGWPCTALAWVGVAVALVLLSLLTYWFGRGVIGRILAFVIRRTETQWDDALLRRRLFVRLSHLGPAFVLFACAPLLPPADRVLERAAIVYFMAIGLLASLSFLDAAVDIYATYPVSKQRPIKGLVEIVKILLILFIGVLALAVILDRSPWIVLSGLGAMTAVLLIVFKDSLLGFVAGVQLTVNDMVAIGDWIEMPKYGADGEVVDLTLHTVKVRNWDMTITTVPSYALVSDSFKNWRGMARAGARRIKRAVHLDLASVRFCTSEMIDRYAKEPILAEGMAELKRAAVAQNRPITNVGVFRAYVEAFLRAHPRVNREMTLIVRELDPGPNGLPLELYCFAADPKWASYEAVQADLVDHIVAKAPEFDLRVFQLPSGADLEKLAAR